MSDDAPKKSTTELEQALVRFVIGLMVAGFFLFAYDEASGTADSHYFGTFIVIFFFSSVLLVVANLQWPRPNRWRRITSIALDMSSIS